MAEDSTLPTNDPHPPRAPEPASDLTAGDEAGWSPPVPLTRAVSRRSFLRTGGVAAAGVAVAGAGSLAGCEPARPEIAARGPAANMPPATTHLSAHPPQTLVFFTPTEARAVEALAARILPGDAADPGAREAGVLYYIDRTLSMGDGFAEPTYRQGPFAQPYDGDTPPDSTADAVPVVWIPRDQWERYGWQTPLTPREIYRRGLDALDALARTGVGGAAFADLGEAQQDALVRRMAGSEGAVAVPGFDAPTAREFFEVVRTHVVEGMFSDPVHGGNRDMVGWRLVGHPGSQRAYTASDMLDEQHHLRRPVQSIANLPPVHPGQPDRADAVYPVRGSHHLGRGR